MTAVVQNPQTTTVFLFIVSFLLTAMIILLGFIGNGFNKRIDATQKKFETVFAEFKKYRTKEICKIYREYDKTQTEKNQNDINELGTKVEKIDKKNT